MHGGQLAAPRPVPRARLRAETEHSAKGWQSAQRIYPLAFLKPPYLFFPFGSLALESLGFASGFCGVQQAQGLTGERRRFPSPRPPLSRPTDGGQLRHAADVGPLQEAWLAVVDVLHLDDELRLGLQQLVRLPVPGLRPQRVEGFLLPVQALGGVDVTCDLIDEEDGPCALPGDRVLDGAVSLIRV